MGLVLVLILCGVIYVVCRLADMGGTGVIESREYEANLHKPNKPATVVPINLKKDSTSKLNTHQIGEARVLFTGHSDMLVHDFIIDGVAVSPLDIVRLLNNKSTFDGSPFYNELKDFDSIIIVIATEGLYLYIERGYVLIPKREFIRINGLSSGKFRGVRAPRLYTHKYITIEEDHKKQMYIKELKTRSIFYPDNLTNVKDLMFILNEGKHNDVDPTQYEKGVAAALQFIFPGVKTQHHGPGNKLGDASSGDGGVDVSMQTNNGDIVLVSCKRYAGKPGRPEVANLGGALQDKTLIGKNLNAIGFIVSPNGLTVDGEKFCKSAFKVQVNETSNLLDILETLKERPPQGGVPLITSISTSDLKSKILASKDLFTIFEYGHPTLVNLSINEVIEKQRQSTSTYFIKKSNPL